MLDELMIQATAFADAVHAGDRGATVPTCPDWTLRDLTVHVGRTHRRVAATVTGGTGALVARADVDDAEPPESVDGTSTWLLEGAARVTTALRAAGDALVAGFADPVPASFWARRMVHETLVHRFDAEITAGVEPWTGVAPELAADGVAEGFEMLETYGAMQPGLGGSGQTVHVHATDTADGEWLVTREPGGIRIERVHRTADVAVRGTALGLLAVVTNRRGPADAGVEVLGDEAVLADWLRAAAMRGADGT